MTSLRPKRSRTRRAAERAPVPSPALTADLATDLAAELAPEVQSILTELVQGMPDRDDPFAGTLLCLLASWHLLPPTSRGPAVQRLLNAELDQHAAGRRDDLSDRLTNARAGYFNDLLARLFRVAATPPPLQALMAQTVRMSQVRLDLDEIAFIRRHAPMTLFEVDAMRATHAPHGMPC